MLADLETGIYPEIAARAVIPSTGHVRRDSCESSGGCERVDSNLLSRGGLEHQHNSRGKSGFRDPGDAKSDAIRRCPSLQVVADALKDTELASLVADWQTMPDAVRGAIVQLARLARGGGV